MEKTYTLDEMMIPSNDYQEYFTLDEANLVEKKVDFSKPDELGYLASIAEAFVRGNRSSSLDTRMYESLLKGERDYYDNVKPEKTKFYLEMQKKRLDDSNWFKSATISVSEMLPAMGKGMAAGATVGAAGAGLALAGGALIPIAVPGAFAAGQVVGSAQYWYRQGAGNLYGELKDENIPDNIAQPTSHVAGALYSAIEFSQMSRIIPGGKEATKKLIVESVKKSLANVAKKYGANWTQNVLEEGLQQVVVDTAKEVSSSIAGKSNTAIGDKVYNVMTGGWNAMKESAIPMLMLLGPSSAMDAKNVLDETNKTPKTVEANDTTQVEQPSQQDIPETQTVSVSPSKTIDPSSPLAYKTAEEYVASKFKVKPPKKLFRGVAKGLQEDGSEGFGTFNLGKGLYSTFTKSFAKKYGDVVELNPIEAFPKNPLFLNASGDSKGAFTDWLLKESGEKRLSDFNKKYPDPSEFVKSKGYDGVIVGDEIVKYDVGDAGSTQLTAEWEAAQKEQKVASNSAESYNRLLAVKVGDKVYAQPKGDTRVQNYNDLLDMFNLDDSDVGYGFIDANGSYREADTSPAVKTATNAPAVTPEQLKEKLSQLHKFGMLQAIPRKIGGTGKRSYAGVFRGKGKKGEIVVRPEYAVSDKDYVGILAHELGHAIHHHIAGNTRRAISSIFSDNLSKEDKATLHSELAKITHDLVGEATAKADPSYYYKPTEMFARFLEKMIVSPGNISDIAPKTVELFEKRLIEKPILSEFIEAAHSEIDKGVPKVMLLRDMRQMYQKHLGKKVGNRAFNNEMLYRSMKERGKKVIGELIESKFKNVKDEPQLLFRAAESIRITRDGNPEFGTRDFQTARSVEEQENLKSAGWEDTGIRNLEDGQEVAVFSKYKYTPEESKAIFDSLSSEGQQIVKDFTSSLNEAKDLFNREMIKDAYKVNGNIEGWVHHYWEDKPSILGGMKIKEKVAGAKKHREGATGYVEDLRKSIHKALVDLETEKQYNKFIDDFFAMVTKPLADDQEPDPGWVEVVGDVKKGVGKSQERKMVIVDKGTGQSFVPKRHKYQMPKEIYDRYKLIKGDLEEYSNVMKAILALNRYWRINILTDPSSTATNAISGALQYSAKILDDMYLELLSGDLSMQKTKNNVGALITAATPKGWADAPDWVYGADKSNFYGQFLTNDKSAIDTKLDEYGNKVLALFGLVERYFKKAIVLSESEPDYSDMEKIDKTGIRDLRDDEKELLTRLIDDIDVYALDYDNIPSWLQSWSRSPMGAAVKPFAVFPYKITKTYLRMAGDIFDRSIDWRTRTAKLLSLATMVGLFGLYGYTRRERQITPQGDEATPSWLRPKGRLPISVDDDGREVFVRTSKYPFLSVSDAGVNLAKGQADAALEVFKDTIGSIGPVGQLGLLGLGYVNKYNQYTPTEVLVGDALASYTPFYRTLQNISNALDPNLRRKEHLYQSFTSLIPTTDSNLQDLLHGEARTGKVPIKREVRGRKTKDVEIKREAEDVLLYSLTGISVSRIDPEMAKNYEIRRKEIAEKKQKKKRGE